MEQKAEAFFMNNRMQKALCSLSPVLRPQCSCSKDAHSSPSSPEALNGKNMGFYYRKSVSIGPFWVNSSRSGVGYSAAGRNLSEKIFACASLIGARAECSGELPTRSSTHPSQAKELC